MLDTLEKLIKNRKTTKSIRQKESIKQTLKHYLVVDL